MNSTTSKHGFAPQSASLSPILPSPPELSSPWLAGSNALAGNTAIPGTLAQMPCPCIAVARRHIDHLLLSIAATGNRLTDAQMALQGAHTIVWEGSAASQAREEARQLALSCQHRARAVQELRLRLESWR
ncbi:hypothetical protein [Bifidobacterium aquikefiricola]|uniref:Uncharacterized protein n=1 Tax=Bifidobacterium aquikefiricola TaxID=3059038 RepID=A0AB39U4S4_9BIFI